jgi:hypothetical protein
METVQKCINVDSRVIPLSKNFGIFVEDIERVDMKSPKSSKEL